MVFPGTERTKTKRSDFSSPERAKCSDVLRPGCPCILPRRPTSRRPHVKDTEPTLLHEIPALPPRRLGNAERPSGAGGGAPTLPAPGQEVRARAYPPLPRPPRSWLQPERDLGGTDPGRSSHLRYTGDSYSGVRGRAPELWRSDSLRHRSRRRSSPACASLSPTAHAAPPRSAQAPTDRRPLFPTDHRVQVLREQGRSEITGDAFSQFSLTF